MTAANGEAPHRRQPGEAIGRSKHRNLTTKPRLPAHAELEFVSWEPGTSGLVQRWIWFTHMARDRMQNATSLRVGAALAERINNKDGDCYPSIETLQVDALASKTQVVDAIRRLERRGWTRVDRSGKSNRYRLTYWPELVQTLSGLRSWPRSIGTENRTRQDRDSAPDRYGIPALNPPMNPVRNPEEDSAFDGSDDSGEDSREDVATFFVRLIREQCPAWPVTIDGRAA